MSGSKTAIGGRKTNRHAARKQRADFSIISVCGSLKLFAGLFRAVLTISPPHDERSKYRTKATEQ
jgi:hypothetical protein